jgi:hypothetical protein
MTKELEKLFVIGQAFVEGELWEEVVNLLEDDNDKVQQEALTLLLKTLKSSSSDFRVSQALPYVIDALTKPYAAQVVLSWAGEVMQVCCKELETLGKLRLFMEFYRTQLLSSDLDTVLVAARCLPEVLLGLGTARKDYDSLLLGVMRSCHSEVRKLTATRLSAIVCVYSRHSDLMQTMTQELLEDSDTSVIVLTSLPSLIDQGGLDTGKLYSHLLDLLRHSNWRVQFSSVVAVQSLLKTSDQPYVRDSLPERLCEIMQNSAVPARNKAAEALAQLVSILPYSDLRREMVDYLTTHFAQSANHQARQVFLEFCVHALSFFSRCFFNANFLDFLRPMSSDPVTSVRTKFARLIPFFRKGLASEASFELADVVNRLMQDPQRTVADAAGDAHSAMLQANYWRSLDSEEVLRADQAKEEAESRLLAQEQRSLEDIKRQFVDQLALRAKQDYKASKLRPKVSQRASMKGQMSPTLSKASATKRSSMADIRSTLKTKK